MSEATVLAIEPLGFPWKTADPFLFCAHHDDAYPAGNAEMGPAASLEGRNIGADFEIKDGWRMYHGETVPGFPQHPHRGFETITLARRGYIDHTDSLGATARFGHGDVQWMTAGRGVVHSEMFPLVHQDRDNPCELFQVWLNLPSSQKMVDPYFTMIWAPDIPVVNLSDEDNRNAEIRVIAGPFDSVQPPAPPPNSWAAQPGSDVVVWTVRMAPGARLTLPAARPGRTRTAYFFRGEALEVGGQRIERHAAISMNAQLPQSITNYDTEAELLILGGKPIGQPVAHYGPFVMNSPAQIREALRDYQRTQFGGWPWPSDTPVHPRERGRFARHADGREETPPPDSA